MPQLTMILAIHLRAPNFFNNTLLGTSKEEIADEKDTGARAESRLTQ